MWNHCGSNFERLPFPQRRFSNNCSMFYFDLTHYLDFISIGHVAGVIHKWLCGLVSSSKPITLCYILRVREREP